MGNPPDRTPSPKRAKRKSVERLRELTADDTRLMLREYRLSSDRTACLIMSAYVERYLENMLLTRLGLSKDPESYAILFARDGALSTFYGNIHLAHALGLVTDPMLNGLNSLRKIRNMFAHSHLPLSFQSTDIRNEIAKMPDPPPSFEETLKQVFPDLGEPDAKDVADKPIARDEFSLEKIKVFGCSLWLTVEMLAALKRHIRRFDRILEALPPVKTPS